MTPTLDFTSSNSDKSQCSSTHGVQESSQPSQASQVDMFASAPEQEKAPEKEQPGEKEKATEKEQPGEKEKAAQHDELVTY